MIMIMIIVMIMSMVSVERENQRHEIIAIICSRQHTDKNRHIYAYMYSSFDPLMHTYTYIHSTYLSLPRRFDDNDQVLRINHCKWRILHHGREYFLYLLSKIEEIHFPSTERSIQSPLRP